MSRQLRSVSCERCDGIVTGRRHFTVAVRPGMVLQGEVYPDCTHLQGSGCESTVKACRRVSSVCQERLRCRYPILAQ